MTSICSLSVREVPSERIIRVGYNLKCVQVKSSNNYRRKPADFLEKKESISEIFFSCFLTVKKSRVKIF